MQKLESIQSCIENIARLKLSLILYNSDIRDNPYFSLFVGPLSGCMLNVHKWE